MNLPKIILYLIVESLIGWSIFHRLRKPKVSVTQTTATDPHTRS